MNDGGFVAGALTGLILCTIVFVWTAAICDVCPRAEWEKKAVAAGAGEYNNKTGKFQWVTIKPESVCE